MTSGTPRAAFAHRDFRLYQASRLLITLALQIQSVAIAWYIYERTGSALDLGYVGLAQFLPGLLLALATGHAADRFDRRALVQWSYALIAVCGFLFFAETRFPVASLWPLYGVLVLLGTARAFLGPAGQALIPDLVPKEELPSAVAWGSTVWQIATIAGPSLGGILYGAFGSAGGVFFSGGLLTIGAMICAGAMKVRTGRMEQGAPSWNLVLAGVRFVWKAKIVLACISLDLFAVLLGGAVALLPIYAKDVLHTGPWGLGLLRSAPAVGAAVMAIWLAHRPLARDTGKWMLVAVGLFGAATVVFGLSRNFGLSLGALVTLGAADMVSVVIRQTLLQLATPPAMRGRVGAVDRVFVGASNELGEFESGVTAAWFGLVPAVVLGGLGTIAVVLLWAALFPELRKIHSLADVKAPEVY